MQPYQHTALREKGTIRLLCFDTARGAFERSGEIKCTLHPYVVASKTKAYTALSYTWGDPFADIPGESESYHESEHNIICNNEYMSVASNLYFFLVQLVTRQEKSEVCEFLWIDALCIDQKNSGERSEQVSIMGSIYAEAENVIIWLGPADKHSCSYLATALMVNFFEVSKNLDEAEHKAVFANFNTRLPFDTNYEGLFESHYAKNYLYCLGHFFCRSWFRRIWVIQEVVLSKSKFVWCGQCMITWDIMYDFASYLSVRTWKGDVPNAVKNEIGSEMVGKDRIEGIILNAINGIIDATSGESYHSRYALQPGDEDRGAEYEIFLAKAFLWDILEDVRQFEATEPRDYIYAPLVLAAHLRPTLRAHCPEPAYSKAVRDIFAEYSVLFYNMRPDSFPNLCLLEDPVEGRELSADIPSWACSYRQNGNVSLLKYRPNVNVCNGWPNPP